MSQVGDFGAVGDGQADDTQAVQHAIADGDGLLEFGPGTYRFSKTIQVPVGRHGPRPFKVAAAPRRS